MLNRVHAQLVRMRDVITGQTAQPSVIPLGPRTWVPIALFAVCVVLYAVYLSVMQSEWILGGGMWAEMADNYYPNAISDSLRDRLFATDFGYLPLPQRLLGIIGSLLKLPAAAIPYYYTWSAILLTGAMVGSFCLRPFRALVRSDALRFFAAIAVILVADFQTRTYINFTYFGAFFVAVIVALAFVDRGTDSPWYAWFVPLLMISKPAMLVLLPLMFVAAIVGRKRFRWITFAATLTAMAQASILLTNKASVPAANGQPSSAMDKLRSAADYALGYLGAIFLGRTDLIFPVLSGIFLIAVCVVVIWKLPSRASALILCGLSVGALNMAFNAILLSDAWNLQTDRIALYQLAIERNVALTYFGVVLVVVGLLASLIERDGTEISMGRAVALPAAFLAWFVVSGWAAATTSMNELPLPPVLGNSQWERMASSIDADVPVCVPVDPLSWPAATGEIRYQGWMFRRNCKILTDPDPIVMLPPQTDGRARSNETRRYVVKPPQAGSGANLISIGTVVSTSATGELVSTSTATVELRRGGTRTLKTTQALGEGPRMMVLSGIEPIPIKDIASVTIAFESPVSPYRSEKHPVEPALIWMGSGSTAK